MAMSPAWAGMLSYRAPEGLPEETRRAIEAAYSDDLDPEGEADAAGVAPKTHPSSATTKNPNSGVKRSCFGTLPGRGLTPEAISFDYATSMMLCE